MIEFTTAQQFQNKLANGFVSSAKIFEVANQCNLIEYSKVENLLKALNNLNGLLTADFHSLENWQEEIQAVLNAQKELEN